MLAHLVHEAADAVTFLRKLFSGAGITASFGKMVHGLANARVVTNTGVIHHICIHS
jgi:hypothetical protein